MRLPFNRLHNMAGIQEEPTDTHPHPSVSLLFGDTIDRLYRAAIAVNPTPVNLMAYACYLAEHGQFVEALREFGLILKQDTVAGDATLLAEVIHHIAELEDRLENDALIGRSELTSIDSWTEWNAGKRPGDDSAIGAGWNSRAAACESAEVLQNLIGRSINGAPVDISKALAGLDSEMLLEISRLLAMLWTDRIASEQRRTGRSLLKFALFCGKHNWLDIEIACIQNALRSFEQAATEISRPRLPCFEEFHATAAALS